MPVSQKTASALRTCIGTAMATAAIGASYAAMIGGQPKLGATVGLFIGSGVSALEVFVVQRRVGEPLRRMKLPYFIGIMTVLWVLIITIGLHVIPHVYGMSEGLYPKEWAGNKLWQDMAFSLAVAFLVNFFGRIRSLVDSRVLFDFFARALSPTTTGGTRLPVLGSCASRRCCRRNSATYAYNR